MGNNRFAEVFLWGKRIGVVSYEENDKFAKFEYDDEFVNSGLEVSPIMMPLNKSVYYFPNLNKDSFYGLPGLLSESLPDRFGDKIIDTWLQSNNIDRNNFSPIDRLCYTGKRGMGALEYKPAVGPKIDKKEKIEVNKMVKLASEILSNRGSLVIKKDDINYANLLKFSTSVGGARAKAIIAWNRKTNEILSGQIANKKDVDYWVMKFDEVENNGDHNQKDSKGYTRVEYAYYLMAKDAKINISECQLYKDGDMMHFMSLRFDREKNTGEKIHMLSLGAIGHFDYNLPRTCSYELAANICLRMNIGNDEICELFRRMVFNVLAVNNDDHVKNISFLMNKDGEWSLAPAYDLTFAYRSSSPWIGEHQMTINGKSKEITNDDLLSCAEAMNVSRTKAKKIIDEVVKVVKDWPLYANKAGVYKKDIVSINKMINKEIERIIVKSEVK